MKKTQLLNFVCFQETAHSARSSYFIEQMRISWGALFSRSQARILYLTESRDKQRVFGLDSHSSSLIYSTSQFLLNLDLHCIFYFIGGSSLIQALVKLRPI